MPCSDKTFYAIPSAESVHSDEGDFLSDVVETQSDLAAVELDRQVIMEMVAERMQKLTKADGSSVQLIQEGHLVCRASTGIMRPHEGMHFALADSLVGHAVRSARFQYCQDIEYDERVDRAACRKIGLRSILTVPLLQGGEAIGVFSVVSNRPRAFATRQVSALRLMAGLTVASLSHAAELEIKKKLLAERTQALSALRESEERFRSSFDHAAIGMALVALDGRWMQVNQSLCRIVGYDEHELLARDFQSITQPSDLATDLSYVRQLMAGEIADYQMVKRYFHKQGHLVWVLLSVSLVRDAAGKPLYFISQIQDITQRTHSEMALRASEDEYRAIFELAGIGKMQTDLTTGRFVRVNRKFCEITGYTAEELLELSFADITHPDDVKASRESIAQIQSGAIIEHSADERYIRKDGRVIWVNLNATVIRDSQGRALRGVATVQDITDRRQAEQMERDRRRVLEMVAKDLPLPAVLASLADAVEHQIDGSIAAVMLLNNGNIVVHGPKIPDAWHEHLRAACLSLAAKLSPGARNAGDSSGVTFLQTDELWLQLRPAALKEGLAACWATVIHSADGSTLGLLTVFCRRERRPIPAETQTLDMAGKLATICIEHHQTTGQLCHMVRHDALTGLPNRIMFEDRVQQALALARRNNNLVGLMVLDIDKFKSINDTLGHQAGDQLLQQFAKRLRGRLRETDTMARLGGDEFVVILPEMPNIEAAREVAQKLVNSLTQSFALGEVNIIATCSIGIAVFPHDGSDPAALQKKADAALYRVKERGRNGFSF